MPRAAAVLLALALLAPAAARADVTVEETPGSVALRNGQLRLSADLAARAPGELSGIRQRSIAFFLLAGLIPLLASVGLVLVGPDAQTPFFRILHVAFIALGMTGFGFALTASQRFAAMISVILEHARRHS